MASLLVCAIGGALLWHGTDGLRAVTSEQARRRAIARAPRVLPVIRLEDQDGRPFTLEAYRGRAVAVDFIYTQCQSVCKLLSAGFQRIDRGQQAVAADDRLQLVSISFDPRDTPGHLRAAASHYRANGATWRFARVSDPRQLGQLLVAFGIVVIPDGRGDFQHNAAVHLLDREGRLAAVLDADASPEEVLRVAGNTTNASEFHENRRMTARMKTNRPGP
ncbi:MAG TPA: SCO family protein [Gemmatimonadaceae bacterium]|nr:SCO family protein [Gemmatimonadaceae bacterium]